MTLSNRPLHPLFMAEVSGVDLTRPLDAATLDRRLDQLTRLALDKGSALGIASAPRPVTVERIAAWANTLGSKGLVLAPVSALVLPPAKQDQDN